MTDSLPLYAGPELRAAARAQGNAGLIFDKFFDRWDTAAPQVRVPVGEGGRWLGDFVATTNRWLGTLDLDEHARRVIDMVEARQGRWGVVRSVHRLVNGTGRSHPLENGFCWHHLLGVPYLPGSSLKGVAREWAEENAVPPASINSLFGPERRPGREESGGVGSAIFLDAVALSPTLVGEVLTPHFGGWTAKDPPGDWRSPVPIPYLALERGSTFLMALMPRRPAVPEAHAGIEEAWTLLRGAVAHLGVGAKTTMGFGRLVEDPEAGARLRRRPARPDPPPPAPMTAAERWGQRLRGLGAQEVYELARRSLEGEPAPGELAALAQALRDLGFLEQWAQGQRRGDEVTGPRKLKEIARRLEGGGPGIAEHAR